jgi:hypothetical protein
MAKQLLEGEMHFTDLNATSGSSGTPMDRRSFIKLSAAGIASATLIGIADPNKAKAQSGSSLISEFREASEKYNIPTGILLAMGFVNTRWEMPPPEASDYEEGSLHGWGGYGIMALVQNPSSNTLGEASRLTGISEEDLKTDRRSNILGGAALLAASQGRERPTRSGSWLGAVAGEGGGPGGRAIAATSGVGGGKLYAEEVLGVLRSGATHTTRGGERVSLPPQDVSSEDAAEAGLERGDR